MGPASNPIAPDIRHRRLRRLGDLVIYTLIGLGIVAAAVAFATQNPKTKLPDAKWLGLIIFTPVTFGYAIHSSRRKRRSRKSYWGTVAVLLASHIGVYVLVLSHVEHFGMIWYIILNPPESGVIASVLARLGDSEPQSRRSLKGSRDQRI